MTLEVTGPGPSPVQMFLGPMFRTGVRYHVDRLLTVGTQHPLRPDLQHEGWRGSVRLHSPSCSSRTACSHARAASGPARGRARRAVEPLRRRDGGRRTDVFSARSGGRRPPSAGRTASPTPRTRGCASTCSTRSRPRRRRTSGWAARAAAGDRGPRRPRLAPRAGRPGLKVYPGNGTPWGFGFAGGRRGRNRRQFRSPPGPRTRRAAHVLLRGPARRS